MWEAHDDFSDTLAKAWSSTSNNRSASELKQKLEVVSTSLAEWGKETFGSVRLQIRALPNELPHCAVSRGELSLRMSRSRQWSASRRCYIRKR
jgi:hypothetical protein